MAVRESRAASTVALTSRLPRLGSPCGAAAGGGSPFTAGGGVTKGMFQAQVEQQAGTNGVAGVHAYQCITAMPRLQTFSLEELRFNDMFPGKYAPLAPAPKWSVGISRNG